MQKQTLKTIAVLCLFCFSKESECLQCKDNNNNAVDWFVMYKLPMEDDDDNGLIKDGIAYTFMTSNDYDGWKLSGVSINDTKSMLGLTLAPFYSVEKSNKVYILYNDEVPDGAVNFKKGHTKGLVLGDDDGGVWIVHSVPRFPSASNNQYSYPHNGKQYGQSFLCVSLDVPNFDKIGVQLLYNEVAAYSKSLPDKLRTKLPNLAKVVDDGSIETAPWYNRLDFASKSGVAFISFAKGRKFGKALYGDWVAPDLNSSLLVETWPNEPGRLPSDCSNIFKVNNIDAISITTANCSFKSTKDHSKWAVSPASSNNWICIGDINRAKPQNHRGGGTVCFNNKKVATSYQKLIAKYESC